jgi:hypothetical protein
MAMMLLWGSCDSTDLTWQKSRTQERLVLETPPPRQDPSRVAAQLSCHSAKHTVLVSIESEYQDMNLINLVDMLLDILYPHFKEFVPLL